MTGNPGDTRTLQPVKRISPIIILGAIAAFLLMRRRDSDVVNPRLGLEPSRSLVKVGVLASGDTAVRAAHSLSAHDSVEEVVVVGPARSRSFRVVPDASELDLLIGSGDAAPIRARKLGVPLLWDGDNAAEGVVVWGASPVGLALASCP